MCLLASSRALFDGEAHDPFRGRQPDPWRRGGAAARRPPAPGAAQHGSKCRALRSAAEKLFGEAFGALYMANSLRKALIERSVHFGAPLDTPHTPAAALCTLPCRAWRPLKAVRAYHQPRGIDLETEARLQ